MLYLFYFAILLNGLALSMIAPFYPPLANSRGLSTDIIGLILALHPIGQMISTTFMSRFLSKSNYFKILFFALLIQSLSLFAFAFTYYVEELYMFTLLSFLARLTNGIGSGIFFLSFNSLIPLLFPTSIERTFAIVESGIGLGFILGPLIGAILYYFAGYFFMFIIMGLLMSMVVPVLVYIKKQKNTEIERLLFGEEEQEDLLIPKEKKNNTLDCRNPHLQMSQSIINKKSLEKSIKLIDRENLCIQFFRYQKKLIVCVTNSINLIGNFTFFFLEPIQAIYFMDYYKVNQTQASLLIAIFPFCYIFWSIIMTLFKNCKGATINIGLLLLGIGVILNGPAEELIPFLKPSITTVIISQCIISIGIASNFVLIQPFLFELVQDVFELEREKAANIAATLYTVTNAMGSLVGPNVSGQLYKRIGFQQSTGLIGIGICIYSLIVFFVFFIRKRK